VDCLLEGLRARRGFNAGGCCVIGERSGDRRVVRHRHPEERVSLGTVRGRHQRALKRISNSFGRAFRRQCTVNDGKNSSPSGKAQCKSSDHGAVEFVGKKRNWIAQGDQPNKQQSQIWAETANSRRLICSIPGRRPTTFFGAFLAKRPPKSKESRLIDELQLRFRYSSASRANLCRLNSLCHRDRDILPVDLRRNCPIGYQIGWS
jgi:hypothetical protein